MAKISRPQNPDTLLTSRRSYSMWAATVASLAKTPRNLDRPRKDVSDLELAAAVIPEMRRELVELWEAFTLNRSEVSRYLMDPKKEALTYLLGFHLSNLARAQGVLRRSEHRLGLFSWLREQSQTLHIEDLGCGTGALSFATLDLLFRDEKKIPVSLELVDKSRAFLDAAQHGLQQLNPTGEIVTRQQRLDDYLGRENRKPKDASPAITWYQLGYVWNEIANSPKTGQAMLRHLAQGLQQGSSLVTLVEPSNQDLARGAMQMRDQLCEMGYQVLYPCAHSDACPMLERTRDWCYSEWEWQQPPLMQKVDKILDIDRRRLGASAFLFASPDIAMALRTQRKIDVLNDSIVVGRPLDERGGRHAHKFNYLLCSAEGLSKEPADAGYERLRGVVWQKVEKPNITPVSKGIVTKKPGAETETPVDAKKSEASRKPAGNKNAEAPRKPAGNKNAEASRKPAGNKNAEAPRKPAGNKKAEAPRAPAGNKKADAPMKKPVVNKKADAPMRKPTVNKPRKKTAGTKKPASPRRKS